MLISALYIVHSGVLQNTPTSFLTNVGFFNMHRGLQFMSQSVQSIVSLTTLLRCQLVKYMPAKLSNTLFCFLLEKCENLLQCKRFSHFSNKNKCINNINVLNFNETLTNDVVNFEQLAPEGWAMCSCHPFK